MASAYPGGLDTFTTTYVDSTVSATTHKNVHNDENDAINKVEAELGINPSGAYATVALAIAAALALPNSRAFGYFAG